MASRSDDTPPCHSEKHSKKNNDPTGSSRPPRRTKASLPHDAAGGRGAHARAQAQALPVGAAARELVLVLVMFPLSILLKKLLIKKEGPLLKMSTP